jgi:hypothetical protein
MLVDAVYESISSEIVTITMLDVHHKARLTTPELEVKV